MDLSTLDQLKWMQQEQMVSPEFRHILGLDGREDLKGIYELHNFRHFPEFEPNYDTIDGCISRTSSFKMEHSKNNEDNNKDSALQHKRKIEGKEEHIEKNKKKKQKIKAEDEIETSSENHKQDYIHVRARRGEATDRHSLVERARREKISKKMKCLQDIVPGCNKVTGKAGMLDEIINYVQSLQQQVEFLSMKLSVFNPELEFHVNDLSTKQGYFIDLQEAISKQTMMADLCSFPLHQQGSLDYSVISSNQTTSLLTRDQSSSSWDTQSQCLYNNLRTDSVSNFFSLK